MSSPNTVQSNIMSLTGLFYVCVVVKMTGILFDKNVVSVSFHIPDAAEVVCVGQ